jgi:hypothetical protein
MRRTWIWLAVLVWFAVPALLAEEPAGRDVTVHLKDGSALVGTITDQDERRIKVVTRSGVEVDVPRASIASIDEGQGTPVAEPLIDDTRLFFGPTGRPLRRGAGYFSDHWVLFPGVAYGVTDNVTLAGGVSVIPGLGLDEQVAYFTPKVGARIGRNLSLSAGGLLAHSGFDDDDDVTVRVGYVVSTFGTPEHSVTAGVAFGQAGDDGGGDTQPIVMLGGTSRLSKRLSLVSENWLLLGDDFDLDEQPFSLGLRFRGDRLTVDLGVILIGDALRDGVPIPWLSFAYHFGARAPK